MSDQPFIEFLLTDPESRAALNVDGMTREEFVQLVVDAAVADQIATYQRCMDDPSTIPSMWCADHTSSDAQFLGQVATQWGDNR